MPRFAKILTLASAISLMGGVALADSITKPNTFSAGDTIKSADVNANFDTVYGQVNRIGGIINTDAANKRIGINISSPQAALQVMSDASLPSFTVPDHGGIGSATRHRILMATGEPGLMLSSDLQSGLTRTGTETSLLGLQIGATFPKQPSGQQPRGTYNQLYFGGNPFVIVYAAPATDSSNDTFPLERFRIDTSGNVGIGITPSYPLHMASGAYVTTGGVWTNASSRDFKENIADLSGADAQATLAKLTPVTYAYKKDPAEKHVGFIAEDVPDLLATQDRKGVSAMDVVAVVTKVVQEQQETIQKQGQEIQELRAALQKTLAGIASLKQDVSHLQSGQREAVLRPVAY
ncbi:MAG: tail fiber domain-containing protein [Magnetococcales bacterium]|nr:tail fiber domain-containing protein [Magnetococcales bacterium]